MKVSIKVAPKLTPEEKKFIQDGQKADKKWKKTDKIIKKLEEDMPLHIRDIHKFCTNNKENLSKSELCGCFYCVDVYPASEVTEYMPNENTAECAHCGIDTVLPDNQYFKLNQDLLKEMKRCWF